MASRRGGPARQKAGKRRGTGGRSRASGRPPTTLDQIFDNLLRAAARELLTTDDPLEAECWASGVLAVWDDLPLFDEDPERLFGDGLVRHAERRGTPAALAVLHALASVAPPRLAGQARAAARQLVARGTASPAWAGAVGRAALTGAWVAADDYGDQDLLVAAFAYPDGREHSLSVLLDHNLMGLAKDAYPGPPAEQVLALWSDRDPHVSVSAVAPQRAADLLAEGLEAAEVIIDPPVTDDFRQSRALLRARLGAMPAPAECSLPELDDAAREALVRDFLASPEGAGLAKDEEAWHICDSLVDFRCDDGDGLPLRWSPIVVELCLLDHFARRVHLDDEAMARVPELVGRWVRYAGRRRGLAADLIEETLEALESFREEFLGAAADPARFGPAKQILRQMEADGVLGDEAAMQAWIAEYNAGLAGRPAG